MMDREAVAAYLTQMGVSYEEVQHKAVYTMAEMEQEGIDRLGMVCKNLFLKDDKGRQHFLVVLAQDKSADLKALAKQLGSRPLGFASEERLYKYLGLQKGEVTPLGILNDEERAVTVVLDRSLQEQPKLGVHPNDNHYTIWLSCAALCQVIENHGNPLIWADFA